VSGIIQWSLPPPPMPTDGRAEPGRGPTAETDTDRRPLAEPATDPAGVPAADPATDPALEQGLTLVHIRAQLEQLQDTFMSQVGSYGGQKSSS
jgi:hypothetical protein